MTQFRARLACLAVAALTVSVACNAMLLQREPAPARGKSVKGAEIATAGLPPGMTAAQSERDLWQLRLKRLEAEARGLAIPGPGRASAQPSVEPDGSLSPPSLQTIRAIQRELSDRGYDPGPIDGNLGLTTRAAIMAFEHDQGQPLSGEPSEALLRRMILGHSSEETAPLPVPRSREHAERLMRGVQQALASLSYAPGQVDGQLSADTARAIREFEMDQGLVPTGRVSGRLIVRLARAAGKAFVVPVR